MMPTAKVSQPARESVMMEVTVQRSAVLATKRRQVPEVAYDSPFTRWVSFKSCSNRSGFILTPVRLL
jgi:hypothetical protein